MPGRRTATPLVASDGVTTPGSSPDDYWRRPTPGPHDATGDGDTTGQGNATGAGDTTGPGPENATGAGDRPAAPAPSHGRRPEGYAGPPPTTPPPPGWRPPLHVQPPPPRRLPPQDMAELDLAEQRAQRLTWTVGAVAGALLLVLTCALCSRLLL